MYYMRKRVSVSGEEGVASQLKLPLHNGRILGKERSSCIYALSEFNLVVAHAVHPEIGHVYLQLCKLQFGGSRPSRLRKPNTLIEITLRPNLYKEHAFKDHTSSQQLWFSI